MLRSAFILSAGMIGSTAGLAAAMGLQCGTFGSVIGPLTFGVICGVAANKFFRVIVPDRTLVRQPIEQKPRRESPPQDFRERLSVLTKLTGPESGSQEDAFRSDMPFWAVPLPSTATPAKSSRFVRLILLRIRQILRS